MIACSAAKESRHQTAEINILIPETPQSVENILSWDFGNYLRYYDNFDYSVGITSSKYNPRCKEFIYAFEGPNTKAITKSDTERPQIEVLFNGQDYLSPDVKSNTSSDIHGLFGRRLKISLTNKASRNTKQVKTITTELAAPEILEVTNPLYDAEDDLIPLCDYENFVVEWNQDSNNTNGVIVLVLWAGSMMFGDSYDNVLIRNVDCVPDTGFAVLKEDLFDGIPDTALCFLLMLRGDIENVQIDDCVYQLSARTQVVLPFVLVREMV